MEGNCTHNPEDWKNNFLTDHSKAVLLLWILFAISVSCHTVWSVPCSLMVACWERADLLALLNVMFLVLFFITFQYGVWIRCGI